MDTTLQQRLLEKLRAVDDGETVSHHVVLLPDFFVDHVLALGSFDQAASRVKDIYRQGGGNLPGVPQNIHHGGNAANAALALAKLGITAHLICRTDDFGLHLLNYFLGREGVDLSGVKADGKLAITTALEFGEQHTNVMIGDVGSVADFSFDRLDEHDLQMIADADVVCVLNWNLNKKGTALAKQTFSFANKHQTTTFFDTGDPSPRKRELSELQKLLADTHLDILGINENELRYYSNCICNSDEDVVNAAASLKQNIHARVDLHTDRFACTISNNATVVPVLQVPKIYRTTGAGDAWNAGDIFAELLHFDDDERLLCASAIAGYYISSHEPMHPTLNQLIKFLSEIA